MILKLLLVIFVIAIVYFMFIKNKPHTSKTKEDSPNDMVECNNCGVYCQADDSIISNGKYYCSQECLEEQK